MIKIPTYQEVSERIAKFEEFTEEGAIPELPRYFVDRIDSWTPMFKKHGIDPPTPLDVFIYEEEPISLSSKKDFYKNLSNMLAYVVEVETEKHRKTIYDLMEEKEDLEEKIFIKNIALLGILVLMLYKILSATFL